MPLLFIGLIKSLLYFTYGSLFGKNYKGEYKRPDYDGKKLLVFIIFCLSLLINYVGYNTLVRMLEHDLKSEKELELYKKQCPGIVIDQEGNSEEE